MSQTIYIENLYINIVCLYDIFNMHFINLCICHVYCIPHVLFPALYFSGNSYNMLCHHSYITI